MFSTTVESLQKKAAKTIDVFTKTVNELTDINTEILKEEEKRKEEISSLEKERFELETTRANNSKVIAKISAILA